MPARALRRAVGVALALGLAGTPACKRRHVPVDAVPELGYPACAEAGAEVIAGKGHIRSGELSAEKTVVETFEMRRTVCGYTFVSHQEWPLGISDVEVRFDPELSPIWAWKRMTIPGSKRADGYADFRRYELRSDDVFIKHRDPDGQIVMQKLLPGGKGKVPPGERVGAIIGPGRGILTAWLQRAKLPVGGKTHALVLDFRDMIESLEMGALERDPDQYEPAYGKNVRVYTFFGKETVFADDDDVVIGDLAGMRPGDRVSFPEPPPMPTYGAPDPVHTP